MQPAKSKIKGIKYELSFEIPASEFEGRLSAELGKFAETHAEKGFRKGKVPMDVIRAKYENRFVGETLNSIINVALSAYCAQSKIRPAVPPSIAVDSFVRGQPLKFSASFEIMPKLEAPDFSKMTIEKLTAVASDKDVDEAIRNIADSRHTSEEPKKPRKAGKGDIAIIDFSGSIDGKEFEGGKGADYPLELGSGSFIPGFEDRLLGASKGDLVDIKVVFPKDYGHAELAGKKALFKVEVKSIREKIVPEIDDAFARELKRENLDDLRKYVRGLLDKNYEDTAKSLMRERLLDELAREKIEVPESLVEREVEYMLSSRSHDRGAMSEKELGKERAALRDKAFSRVKLGLILADVGAREKIEVSEADMRQAIMREAMRFPDQADRVFEYYSNDREAGESVRAGIFEDKVLDLILSRVRTKEKKVDPRELARKK